MNLEDSIFVGNPIAREIAKLAILTIAISPAIVIRIEQKTALKFYRYFKHSI